jgi:hypothetical protein
MSNAFQFRMPAGIPGDLSRPATATVEAQILDATYYPTVFGVPGTIDSTSLKFRKIKAGDTASSVTGLYVRPYPMTGNGTDGLGTSTPPVSGIANVLKRGYMTVQLNGATASAKNGVVYVRTVANGGNTIIGGIEAAADSTNTFVLANAYFTGPADSGGNVEIAYNL